MKRLFFFLSMLGLVSYAIAQVSYNANTRVSPYQDYFLYGSNMMAPPAGWYDENVAEILIGNPSKSIAGVGVTSLRPAMYDYFVETWGYENRLNAFKFYQQIGAKNNTIFLNGPAEYHNDKTQYCPGRGSEIFANMYEPIWINGNINPNNYYANYVYNLVKIYGPYVKFWEVWNEPDLTDWSVTSSWDTTNPNPCDLWNLFAPIQRYVRLLRITYEVVKSVDPDAYICIGGIGYPSFLEAVLRNTDNPVDGSVSGEYVLTGGAWFDCLSFHIYPMYYLGNEWIGYKRNSDEAVNSIISYKNDYDTRLAKYGYDGNTYPVKEFIITECNIPSVQAYETIGSDEAQRNFLIKAAVICQKLNIQGLYVFTVADDGGSVNWNSYASMGLNQSIDGKTPDKVVPKPGGIAWRTASRLLKERRYDKAGTEALQLPANVDGAAFYSEKDEDYIYVLWAKQSGDKVESQQATYSFPASMNVESMIQNTWEEKETTISDKQITLTGSPVFVKIKTSTAIKNIDRRKNFAIVFPNPNDGKFTLNFEKQDKYQITISDITGKIIFHETVSGDSYDIDIVNQPAGVYLVMINNDIWSTVVKIVKQ